METTICSNQGFFTFYFLQIKEKAAIAIHGNGYKASTALDNHLSTHFQNQAVKNLRQKKKNLLVIETHSFQLESITHGIA